ncbi:MAG: SDR family oxidoreductase [Fulvivirga sp.]|uniref:SDR family oxidoreductase n=1 Tax=Fulvivirga sp. TaxID=1931237 RepID=UPI0032EEEFC1
MAKIDLKDKVVLIAGGAKNLGGLISREMAKKGSKIVVHYNSDSTKSAADETVNAVKELGSDAFSIQLDLTKAGNVKKLFKEAKDKFGRVDIAVNTVGMVLKKPFAETTEAEFDKMDAINNKSAYFFIQEAGKTLEENGKIISIVTSLLGAFTGYYSTYAGNKAPVEHYTRAAAKEYAQKGISVTAVGPGPMDTPFFYGQETPEAVEFHKSMGMGGQLTQIEDIVPIVGFLATDGWWITGQTILANGGYTTK